MHTEIKNKAKNIVVGGYSGMGRLLRGENITQVVLIILMTLWLVITVVLPMIQLFAQAFTDEAGEYVGLTNFIKYFKNPVLLQSLFNTIYVSSITAIVSVFLALGYSYAVVRSAIPFKTFFRYIALLPLFAPSMAQGIALVYLFGNKGLFTNGFLGLLPMFNIHLYGSVGIIISEVAYTFPQVFLILFISLASADYRLYEAADVLGAGSLRKFFTVTLPNIRYAIFSSIFVCFTMSFVDFGAPKIVGGQFNVLATDVYKQVVGQHNMTMGATVGMILLLPAVLSFVIDRIMQKKQRAGLTSKSTPYQITPKRDRDILLFVGCSLVAGAIVFLNFTILFASFIKAWPYDLSLTAVNYNFSGVSSHGLGPYYNSLIAASFTAILGTVITFTNAYVMEKLRPLPWLRQATYAMSLLPMALPGIVIGLSYAFFFNKLTFEVPIIGTVENPFNWIYGTMAIIVLANVFHYYSVPFITATTALKKLDNEFELVSESMAVPFYKTFFSVSVPISILAIMEIMMYYFVTAMVTVSAVIFLYTPETKLSSVAIVSMEDNGDISSAAAMSILIILTNVVVRLMYELSTRVIRKKTMAWQKPKEM